MPTTTTTSTQTGLTQNIPSNLQQQFGGGLAGAAQGLIWPGGNFGLAPVYSGNLTAPQGGQTVGWYSNVNATPRPDYGGVMQGAQFIGNEAQSGLRDPNAINLTGSYTPQQFNVNPLSFQDPLAGYQGGGPGTQVQAPGGIGGKASDYQINYNQIQAPQGVQAQMVSGLPQIQAPTLQNYQMGPAQQVQAPGGLSSFQIAQGAAPVGAGTVGTQSWTDPGTAQQFMSPYTQQVVNTQLAQAQQQNAQALEGIRSQAAQAGAFGGSRQAVQEGVQNLGFQQMAAGLEAQGLQNAYQQGTQQFNTQQALGLQGQQFNVQSGLQAALANQQVQQQASLANQQAALAAQGLGTTTGLQANLANQQAGLTVGGQNLQALLQTQGLGAQLGMQGQLANQQTALQSALANQQAGLQAGEFNNQQVMQAQQLNQAAGIQTGLAAQQMGLQGALYGGQMALQAQGMNQQAQQAQYNRMLQGLTTQYGGGMQAGLQGQQLGMTAQNLGMQSNQFGANYGLQQQVQQAQLQQAQQAQNLGYLNLAGNQNQNMGNWQTQGFNNQLAFNQQLGTTATNQQAYDQAGADRAYQDWLRQQNYPMQMVSWGAGILGQMPQQGAVQSTQQGVQYNTTPGPNWWNIAAGLGATALGAFTGGLGTGIANNAFGS